jgi:hypothetical protein
MRNRTVEKQITRSAISIALPLLVGGAGISVFRSVRRFAWEWIGNDAIPSVRLL